jgi:hypothetical protein
MITPTNLSVLLDQTLRHLERLGVTSLDSSKVDYYWMLGDEQFDMTAQPELQVGSLHDDVACLEASLVDPTRASVLDLDRLASILKALSVQALACKS